MGVAKVDMISQLQDHLSSACSLFVNFTGAIQRDAPPSRVGDHKVLDELLIPNRPTLPPTKDLAKDLLQCFKTMDTLLAQIPELTQTEEQQLEAIRLLQVQHDSLGSELRQQAAATEELQQQVQSLHAVLAGFLLK
ncbi:hypothetical protein WJX74_005132 [Apatococcus lobatus]|uniref:Mediator of RNA polymerase II transcription subunit 21 n=2 Tax=Apatococcus TaxID=904362 RepID=A0AAW1T564_9CHLO